MKLNYIVFPLTLALAAMLATTGCHKRGTSRMTDVNHPANTTPIAPTSPPDINTKPINTIDTTPVATPTPPPYTAGPIDTSTNWDPATVNQDTQKLAAYTVHFKFDSAVVEDSEQSNIAAVADALKGDDKADLLIGGHCDERGTEEYNRSLGERRALALREALAKIGVNADRIRTISYGKDKPLDPGHDEAAWTKNRRGEFIWCTPKTSIP